MKLVINNCWGAFAIEKSIAEKYGFDRAIERDDPRLISLIESGVDCSDSYVSELVVVEVPDDATDYEIEEDDGYESIIYVVDGKIHHLYA